MEIEMEIRLCRLCEKPFKVSTKSLQEFHSRLCEEELKLRPKGWQGERRSRSPPVKSKPESVSVSVTTMIPRSRRSTTRGINKTMIPIETASLLEVENDIIKIENRESLRDKNGHEITRRDNLQPKENITPITENASRKSSMTESTAETQHEGSIVPYTTASKDVSASMTLLDDTAKHLHDLMKNIVVDKSPLDVRRFLSDNVNAACNCAKNIREIMKLKLDAIKLHEEIRKSRLR